MTSNIRRKGLFFTSFRQLCKQVVIGDISGVRESIRKPRVPNGYLEAHRSSQTDLSHLRWLLQKNALKQDVFLLGPPSPRKRQIAMAYCEMMNKEVEYVALSSDTTESDLKQRREIINGSILFQNQAPIRAALSGAVLILDGIEKAERNVLPTLNNLLENREIHLEDGSFILNSGTYDNLIASGETTESLSAKKLFKAHEDFRVFALGVPVPPFKGKPIDPPLRSRFQCRVIEPLKGDDLWEYLTTRIKSNDIPDGTDQKIKFLYSFVSLIQEATKYEEGTSPILFPESALETVIQTLIKFPEEHIEELIHRSMPPNTKVDDVLKILMDSASLPNSLEANNEFKTSYQFKGVNTDGKSLTFKTKSAEKSISVEGALNSENRSYFQSSKLKKSFFSTSSREKMIASIAQEHIARRAVLLHGKAGVGKSTIVNEYAARMRQNIRLFALYRDMTSRDLLLRRRTDHLGNTTWAYSPLVAAALSGDILVLDGIQRLLPDVLESLEAFLVDGEVHLPDGTKLMIGDRAADNDFDAATGILQIHPNFRVIGLATFKSQAKSEAFRTQELSTCFSSLEVNELPLVDQLKLLQNSFPTFTEKYSDVLYNISNGFAKLDSSLQVTELSTRQLSRLASLNPSSNNELIAVIKSLLLTKFWSIEQQQSLNEIMRKFINSYKPEEEAPSVEINVYQEEVDFGGILFERAKPERPELVPQPLFYESNAHNKTLRDIAVTLKNGQTNLLFIGNQGVGKNKLVDYFLSLAQMEREYIQLHRDSTIQSLTLSPGITDGVVVYEDSPLVKAALHGRVLLVDEADKAPLEVVAVLKSLVEDQDILLADGRRLVAPERCHPDSVEQLVPIHKDFKVWALANRKGFPFLGNDFFEEVGDAFYPFAIDNPDVKSEVELVKQYAPSVEDQILMRLVKAFDDLRDLVNAGVISYPYSTREVVAIAKHMEQYPSDGLVEVVENVIAFDSFQNSLRDTISQVFHRYDIPVGSRTENKYLQVKLAEAKPLLPKILVANWEKK